ncbi:unnamed protein product [Didymodactylos carnosus]|uniref:Reverse transcriptase domain-containing protein n=1 Tax=Didymodactylos carnosus TaxID=1234261 RepID=A0A814U8A2_9BILA|nr:unnamed protein product [Didymodactylos carnosus]CAF1322354.1 unnamed protein product [Didymodactylos carnosus]CAF3935080.1 unnamed protein product [Didymodactylos carnosus]CAF4132778.1 unnamed protein product [Didymodactylos carnosus]
MSSCELETSKENKFIEIAVKTTSTNSSLTISRYNFVTYLRRYYDHSVLPLFRSFIDQNLCLMKLELDLQFLKTCRAENLKPKFTHIKVASAHFKSSESHTKCQQLIIKSVVKLKKNCVSHIHRFVKRLKQNLKQAVNPSDFQSLSAITQSIQNDNRLPWHTRHAKKFDLLRQQRQEQTRQQQLFNHNVVINLSSKNLTKNQYDTLAFGLQYVFPPTSIDHIQLIADIELLYARLCKIQPQCDEWKKIINSFNLQQFRALCDNFRHHTTKNLKKPDNNIRKYIAALKTLANDHTIVITKPDKSKGVVTMDKVDYINKMNDILSDSTKFKKLDHDPTIQKEDTLTRYLLKLHKEGLISESDYKAARLCGSRPARLYGLPKTHKPNLPLRPIMSFIKTFNYKLSKWLAELLQPLRKSSCTIKDTFDFIKLTKTYNTQYSEKQMVSFDIQNLYTQIPIAQTIQIILNKMYPHITQNHQCKKQMHSTKHLCANCLNRETLKKLLEMATTQSHFLFNNQLYEQIDGLFMGSPLAAIMADIYMSHFEEVNMSESDSFSTFPQRIYDLMCFHRGNSIS